MKTGRATFGEPLTVLLIAVSILGGIALAIASSYRPIALWWVMVGCSAINVVRFGARLSRQSRADRSDSAVSQSRVGGTIARALAWSLDAVARGRSSTSKASLDRQHARFLVWFTEHNLLWTTIGFGASLLVWHRFGPTTPALVVMAALMSCGLFAALGAAAGASAPTLGLCWREPCRTPDLRSLRRLVHDIGCVMVLTNRRDYAAACDWAKGGRFHELFLTVDDLARAGVEPGLEAVLAADDPAARRALARKERLDRAVALTPIFAAGVLAALLAVPPFAGSEPLPSLWTIVTRSANTHARNSATADDTSRDRPSNTTTASRERESQKPANEGSSSPSSPRADGDSAQRADGDATSGDAASSASRDGHERPDITGQNGGSSATGDAIASARDGDGRPADRGSDAGGGEGAGAAPGSQGSGGGSSRGSDRSGGLGGRGGGPRGYGTDGVAPQRADSPNALPDVPVNPGKAIEVVLPAFSQAGDDTPGDDPMGTKRKANAPDQAQASRTRHDRTAAPNEPANREPVQRWPNWVFQLLHK